MIQDLQNQFSDAQSLSASAVATNVIDLGLTRDLGPGEEMVVVFSCDVAADQTTGDETYQFEVEYASDTAQTTGRKLITRTIFQAGTPTAPNQDADLLVAGYKFTLDIGTLGTSGAARYLGVRYVLSGTTPTVTMSAQLQPKRMAEAGQAVYAKGYTITH